VPSGTATADILPLTLDDAITRGLQQNLGLLLGQESVREAQGVRREARADLLPQVRAGANVSRQKVSLAPFGFSNLPGFPVLPQVIGPFNVLDARSYVSQTVFDLHAIPRAGKGGAAAAMH
jgi:outer membrane protein TolC